MRQLEKINKMTDKWVLGSDFIVPNLRSKGNLRENIEILANCPEQFARIPRWQVYTITPDEVGNLEHLEKDYDYGNYSAV